MSKALLLTGDTEPVGTWRDDRLVKTSGDRKNQERGQTHWS